MTLVFSIFTNLIWTMTEILSKKKKKETAGKLKCLLITRLLFKSAMSPLLSQNAALLDSLLTYRTDPYVS